MVNFTGSVTFARAQASGNGFRHNGDDFPINLSFYWKSQVGIKYYIINCVCFFFSPIEIGADLTKLRAKQNPYWV